MSITRGPKPYGTQAIERARSALPSEVLALSSPQLNDATDSGRMTLHPQEAPAELKAVIEPAAQASFDARVRPPPEELTHVLNVGQTYLLGQYAATVSDEGTLEIRYRKEHDVGDKVSWFTYSIGATRDGQNDELVVMASIKPGQVTATPDRERPTEPPPNRSETTQITSEEQTKSEELT